MKTTVMISRFFMVVTLLLTSFVFVRVSYSASQNVYLSDIPFIGVHSMFQVDITGVADATPGILHAISSKPNRTLYFQAGIYRIATNLTIPITTGIFIEPGAMFVLTSGHSITINGPILASLTRQFIDTTAGGTATFGPGVSGFISPTWTNSAVPFIPTVVSGGSNGTGNALTGLLLPCYIYPANAYTNATYNGLIASLKKYHNVPAYIILNPSNGSGGVTDGNFTAVINRLHGAGAKILGYVHTSYGLRPSADVLQDIKDWQTYYPVIDGLFVDEVPNNAGGGATAHTTLSGGGVSSVITVDAPGTGYGAFPVVSFSGGGGTGATAHVNSLSGSGVSSIVLDIAGTGYTSIPTVTIESLATDLAYFENITAISHGLKLNPIVLNPGADQIQAYYDNPTGDNQIIYENNGIPSESTLKGDYAGGHMSYPYSVDSVLVYNISTLNATDVQMIRKYSGLLDITDQTSPNPWGALPSYLDTLLYYLSQTYPMAVTGTVTWAPSSLSNLAMTSTTVTVPSCSVGDTVTVGFSQAVPAGAILSGSITSSGVATVTLLNNTGSVLALSSGTLRASCQEQP